MTHLNNPYHPAQFHLIKRASTGGHKHTQVYDATQYHAKPHHGRIPYTLTTHSIGKHDIIPSDANNPDYKIHRGGMFI